MIIKRIKLKNFKCFTKKEVKLHNLVFIQGRNGSGKSSLALDSLLFALYGYVSTNSLSSLPTRNKAKSCTVEIEFEHDNHTFVIIRKYPTKINIFRDDNEVKLSNSIEAQNYINNLIGTRQNFIKFHIVDAYTKEANFLEEGQTALKRILFAHSDTIFNNMRNKLLQLKNTREIFNKDKAVVYKHYPSEKRLQLISSKIDDYTDIEMKFSKELGAFQADQNKIERTIGKLEAEKEDLKSKRDKLLKNTKCYACNQSISDSIQKSLLTEIGKQTTEINNSLRAELTRLENVKDLVATYRQKRENMSSKVQNLIDLKRRLEARLKQKEYKYTTKDIEVVKQAIREIDRLSTYYLTESIKVLEPIINSVLAKIDFHVNFTINDKGKFTLSLQKEDITYDYKDLSTGQKLVLQIAFKLAILMERNETGIIVADEGMSSLDENNLNHIINLFKQFPFQLFFVLHRMRTKVCPICDKKFDSSLEKCPECNVELISLLKDIQIINLNKEE